MAASMLKVLSLIRVLAMFAEDLDGCDVTVDGPFVVVKTFLDAREGPHILYLLATDTADVAKGRRRLNEGQRGL